MSGNPFRPGAGHPPPYLAGRKKEKDEFSRLLKQDVILKNVVLTGLRGLGKTVLLGEFRNMAIREGWAWVESEISETASVSEENLAIRILTDLSVFTSAIPVRSTLHQQVGFNAPSTTETQTLSYDYLIQIYSSTPGLIADKLKSVLRYVATLMRSKQKLIFAYDEAQNLSDNVEKDQFPLSVILDVFQAVQREGLPFMLVLAGLPNLAPKLVEARTFAERMFTVLFLDQLNMDESKDAIRIPLKMSSLSLQKNKKSISIICEACCGYPYFIQFICREAYDIWAVDSSRSIPIKELFLKLDADFFSGRWHKASDRQRELMHTISKLENADSEFTVQEIVNASKEYEKPFSSSHVSQMLSMLCDRGLIYKNRHGKYSFAVPLLHEFIRRQNLLLSSPTPTHQTRKRI